jgi:hypothetical protein
MRSFKNLLISMGAYLLSYQLVGVFAWIFNMAISRIVWSDDLFSAVLEGIVISMPQAICAALGAIVVMYTVDSRRPQRWAWIVATLYYTRGVRWQRPVTFPPPTQDILFHCADHLWPFIVCMIVAYLIARSRRDTLGEPNAEAQTSTPA